MCSCFKIYEKDIMKPSEYDARRARKAKRAAQPTYAWIRPVSTFFLPVRNHYNHLFLLPCSLLLALFLVRPGDPAAAWVTRIMSDAGQPSPFSLAGDVFDKLLHRRLTWRRTLFSNGTDGIIFALKTYHYSKRW